NDGVLVGFCQEDLGLELDAACGDVMSAGDSCGSGLYCIGTSAQDSQCRQLCDVSGVEAPCPQFQGCEEVLRGRAGIVRGFGICIQIP
ncbi:MAG: hypothetical protein VYD19_10090, partial [Myxococcota bacterium]|nr:hypothetical protein [Myxococcota bacterium]